MNCHSHTESANAHYWHSPRESANDPRHRLVCRPLASQPGSRRARHIMENWADYRPKFVKVMPVEYRRALREMEEARMATALAAE